MLESFMHDCGLCWGEGALLPLQYLILGQKQNFHLFTFGVVDDRSLKTAKTLPEKWLVSRRANSETDKQAFTLTFFH